MAKVSVDEYRQQYERALEKGASRARRGSRRSRPAAASPLEVTVSGSRDDLAASVNELLQAALDRKSRVAVRLEALQSLGAFEFLGPRFAPFRAEYIETLRQLATDPRATVRRDALERLALQQDPYARDLLIRGLEQPSDALVPDAVALQYLGHDSHGDVVPLARKVYRRSEGPAREEALRILATDPSSEKLLERLMRDKQEKSSVRRLSATALQGLNPEAFEKAALRVAADDDDFNEIRSTALTALSQRPPEQASSKFVTKVADVNRSTRSRALRSSSNQFLLAQDSEPGSQ